MGQTLEFKHPPKYRVYKDLSTEGCGTTPSGSFMTAYVVSLLSSDMLNYIEKRSFGGNEIRSGFRRFQYLRTTYLRNTILEFLPLTRWTTTTHLSILLVPGSPCCLFFLHWELDGYGGSYDRPWPLRVPTTLIFSSSVLIESRVVDTSPEWLRT